MTASRASSERFVDVGIARIDSDRFTRTGVPEVVFAQHKTLAQCEVAMRTLYESTGFAFATRVPEAYRRELASRLPGARVDEDAKTVAYGALPASHGTIGVVCAGTSDLPVYHEARATCEAFGHALVQRIDAGVAGLHRLLDRFDEFDACDVLIVIAGMEGALPSVVAGLVRAPVIAVPTSVGYGTAFDGVTALLAMMTSCAPGIGVVNIDNGFGAAALAHKMLAHR